VGNIKVNTGGAKGEGSRIKLYSRIEGVEGNDKQASSVLIFEGGEDIINISFVEQSGKSG
jgi:hypothetical protein